MGNRLKINENKNWMRFKMKINENKIKFKMNENGMKFKMKMNEWMKFKMKIEWDLEWKYSEIKMFLILAHSEITKKTI